MSTHARHVSATNPERVRLATGKIKDGHTTVVIPDSDDAYRHIMRLVSRYGRERRRQGEIDTMLGRGTTAEESERQAERSDRAYSRVCFAIRWAMDGGEE